VSFQSTIGIFDAHMSFEQPTELEWAEIDMPDAIVDVLEADIFPGTGDGDVDPVAVPPDATVGADVAHLEAVGLRERGPCVGPLPGGGFRAGGGCAQSERFVRPLMVELGPEVMELPRWCAQVGAGRSGGFGFQGAMPPFVAAVRLGCTGCDALR
jgi:hypothetical protein